MNGHRGSTLPLLDSQEGIWLAQRVESSRRLYNIGQHIEIAGRIDTGVFAHALRQVVSETDVLRVSFAAAAEQPRQRLGQVPDWELTVLDLRAEAQPWSVALPD